MIEVGIKITGQSLLHSTDNVHLNRCMTWNQLRKYKVILLENTKKEDIEQVKALPRELSIYSAGAVDQEIRLITFYIKDVDEIISEKDAVQKEKERSIEQIKQTTEEKVKLERTVTQQTSNINELRERVKELRIESDKKNAENEELKRQIEALTGRLDAETALRKRKEAELNEHNNSLGNILEDNEQKLNTQKEELTTQYTNEIERVKETLQEKNTEIEECHKEIDRLEALNEQLGKSGTIPDIDFNYTGKAHIIGVMGQGSYGVSDLTYTISKILSTSKKCLIIDLDFKGGNLGHYFQSDNRSLDNVLKGGELFREHIIKAIGKVVDYIGGVNRAWEPYNILNLPWDKIFDGDYDYIICDCGSNYGGYNIQTKVCDFIKRIGKMIYVYKDENRTILPQDCLCIKNFSTDNNGIPFISQIIADDSNLFKEPISNEIVRDEIINKII